MDFFLAKVKKNVDEHNFNPYSGNDYRTLAFGLDVRRTYSHTQYSVSSMDHSNPNINFMHILVLQVYK